MIRVLVCNNMCRYERHFGSFYRYPTILETVSIPTTMRILFFNTMSGNNSSTDVSIMIKWEKQRWRIFLYHLPRPVGVKQYQAVLKFPWLRNHLRLINNKNTATSSIRCCDQVFLQSMVFNVKIWTGMVSNNTISWSASYEMLTYFHCELGFIS